MVARPFDLERLQWIVCRPPAATRVRRCNVTIPPEAAGCGEASEVSASQEDWMVVPWVPPPPPEVEILQGGIAVTEIATQVAEWKASGMSVQDIVTTARNKWSLHHHHDLPRLRLAVSLVGATRQTHSFQLLESIQTRLQTDVVGTQTLFSLIQDLLLSAASQ